MFYFHSTLRADINNKIIHFLVNKPKVETSLSWNYIEIIKDSNFACNICMQKQLRKQRLLVIYEVVVFLQNKVQTKGEESLKAEAKLSSLILLVLGT